MSVLVTKNLTMQFGGIRAVSDLNLEIQSGSITALIGPNGAGKTTVFNMLTGVYQPTAGSIEFEGKSIVGLKPHQITRRGISRTFQNIRLFANLSVLDNVRIAGDISNRRGLWQAIIKTPALMRQENQSVFDALRLLKIFNLEHRQHELAKNLPYGEQRRLEIARALGTGVRLLLLDEPAAGMNNQETAALMQVISDIRKDFGLTILLIEHDMKLVMGISE